MRLRVLLWAVCTLGLLAFPLVAAADRGGQDPRADGSRGARETWEVVVSTIVELTSND